MSSLVLVAIITIIFTENSPFEPLFKRNGLSLDISTVLVP
jgi:hypothetical protein